jgi:hypothetical protein
VVRQRREADGCEEGVDFHVPSARRAVRRDGGIFARGSESRIVLFPQVEGDCGAEVQGRGDVREEEGGAEVVCWRRRVGVQRSDVEGEEIHS